VLVKVAIHEWEFLKEKVSEISSAEPSPTHREIFVKEKALAIFFRFNTLVLYWLVVVVGCSRGFANCFNHEING
jgi:hypothetical protein